MTGDVTSLLRRAAAGDKTAEAELMEEVYTYLKERAAAYLAGERGDQTLEATALLHEAYIRLVSQINRDWKTRSHFFGVAAHLVRLILVDHARAHRARKYGGAKRIPLREFDRPRLFVAEQFEHLIAIDDALSQLAQLDERATRVVELRFFGDLSNQEAADVLGVSARTVKDDWQFARVWLHKNLSGDEC
jgi:RNA polymerase sigma-70 factor, ECF subfamily